MVRVCCPLCHQFNIKGIFYGGNMKNINVKELVSIKRNKPFTSSKIIADNSGLKHSTICRIIHKYTKDFEDFGVLEIGYEIKNNKQGEKIYLLNEEQATLLLTYSNNTEKVREFKKTLVKSFYNAKKLIEERKTYEWQQLRVTSKTSTKALHDDLNNKFIPYAINNGSKTYTNRPTLAYTHFDKPINKALGITKSNRGNLDSLKQTLLDIMNKSCSYIVTNEIENETDYHDIVKISKDKIFKISQVLSSCN